MQTKRSQDWPRTIIEIAQRALTLTHVVQMLLLVVAELVAAAVLLLGKNASQPAISDVLHPIDVRPAEGSRLRRRSLGLGEEGRSLSSDKDLAGGYL